MYKKLKVHLGAGRKSTYREHRKEKLKGERGLPPSHFTQLFSVE